MNPFDLKPKKIENCITPLSSLALKPYDKFDVSPYTKVRVILAAGTEFEANWYSHQMSRHTYNNDLRRELAFIRRIEQQQHKKLASLKPIDETILETTLTYEQVAVDLTAMLAKREKNAVVREQLNFALLEDFDHLYRFSDLLDMEEGTKYDKLIGDYTEVMPGRPTVAEHRHPNDDVRYATKASLNDVQTNLNIGIIVAAEQQTMNFYMNLGAYYHSELGRKIFSEIALIEEQHVTGYGSLKDPDETWLECLLMHEYTECYVYYSLFKDETDPNVKRLFESCFEEEVAHLHHVASLLQKYEGKPWCKVIPAPEFPELLKFGENKTYIRNVLKNVRLTSQKEGYKSVNEISDNDDFFKYQKKFVGSGKTAPTHQVIEKYIVRNGEDLRYEIAPHPIEALRDRKNDNIEVARVKNK